MKLNDTKCENANPNAQPPRLSIHIKQFFCFLLCEAGPRIEKNLGELKIPAIVDGTYIKKALARTL